MFKYFSLPNIASGFVGMLVGFTSSAVLVFQAATAAGASQEEISSWILALGVGIASTCIGLSLRYRVPILTGWSTPGAALLATSLSGVPMPEAIGAFMFAALLSFLFGITGLFERLITHIPKTLSSAMLAGILLQFGINVFAAMGHHFSLVCTMFLAYLIGKRMLPRYVIVLVLVLGIFIASTEGLFQLEQFHFALSAPIFTMPVFSLPSLISIGIPLFIVTMTSQNIPGITVIYNAGFRPPISPLISWTGFITFLLAPFGGYSVCLAAITAAICTDKEADSNPATRYKATIFAGCCWILIGVFGAAVVALLAAFPKELIMVVAGLALFGTIGNSLKAALEEDSQREPALITILVSASGVSLFGIGAAFWGLIAGSIALALLTWRKKQAIAVTANPA